MNCGTMEHTDDCLCDVIVAEPTPINYGLSDHWVLSMVAKHFDMSIPFSNADLAFLLEKSHQFIEVYLPLKERIDLPPFKHKAGMELMTRYCKRMKEYVIELVTACEGRILPSEVCRHMKLTEQEFFDGLTAHHATSTLELVDRMVIELRQGKRFTQFARENGFKVTNGIVQNGLLTTIKNIFVTPHIGRDVTIDETAEEYWRSM